MSEVREFVESVCKLIVDDSDAVSVDRKVDDMGVLLTIKVGEGEYGKIIGKEGAIAKAIRTLAKVVGMRSKERVNVKIDAPKKEDLE